jgi:hypothetical protein
MAALLGHLGTTRDFHGMMNHYDSIRRQEMDLAQDGPGYEEEGEEEEPCGDDPLDDALVDDFADDYEANASDASTRCPPAGDRLQSESD